MRTVFPVLTLLLIFICFSFHQAAAQEADKYTAEEQRNLAAAATLMDAFAADDMDTVLSLLADDVVWTINGSSELVASHGTWHGKDGFLEWLDLINSGFEFVEFDTDQFFADGDTVIVLFHDVAVVKATGRQVDQREVALFTFRDGLVVNLLGFDDSAQEYRAMTTDAEAPAPQHD